MKSSITLLEKALQIALKAHEGQTDKSGAEYILHPLRVMMKMESSDEKITAILHDVIEDSDVSLSDLAAEGFPPHIIEAVSCLTRRPYEETYDESLRRVKQNPLALKVKLADLEDNMDIRRLPSLTDADLARLKKYNAAWNFLKFG